MSLRTDFRYLECVIAPLVTDIIVFFVVIGLECSEFKRLDILKEQDD